MKSTRAIHAHVSNPAQAVEMFDGITYTKGEAVLRMLETYVGKDKYQEGIKKYLQAHAFANATASDFWSAIGHEATGVPVPQLMKSFVFQPGYPQVNVSPSADSKTLSFTQYRQFKLGQDKNDPTLWLVPLVARGLGSKADDSAGHLGFLLKDRTQNVDVNANGSPFFINDGGTGYYRTCYEKKQLQEIQNKFADLSTDDKLVLIGDCDSLVLPGDVAVENFLDFTDKLKSEKDPLILSNLVHLIDGVDPFIEEKERTRLQHFTQVTLAPLKQGLDGWNQKESDSEHTKQLRGYVLSDLGTFGHDEKTIGEARELFAKYKADNKSFNPDLVSTVLDVVTYNGSAKEYDEMLSMYKKAKTPADAERALFQLGEFRQPELAKRTFDFCMSKDLKQQHGIRLICELVSNRYIRATSWTLIKQHWDEMQHKFAPEMFANIAGIPAAFDAAQSETELKAWFATHPVPFGKSQVARSLESMHTKVLYRQKYGERIRKWVRNAAERN